MRMAGPGALPALALLLLPLARVRSWAATSRPGRRLFNVSLDAALELRWLPMLRHYDPDLLCTTVLQVVRDGVPKWVLALIGKVVLKLKSLLPQPFTDEIHSMCDFLNLSLLVNLATSTPHSAPVLWLQIPGATVTILGVSHSAFGAILSKLTVHAQFLKNGQIAFTGTTFIGYVGLWTGQSPHKFTDSGDEGDKGWWWENGIAALFQGQSPISWPICTTLSESENFEAAVYKLAKMPLIANVYYIVGGTSPPREGVVITRSRDGPADIWPLWNGAWFRVETNYDHWKPAPKRDDPRTPAIKALNATGPENLSLETLFQVLSVAPVCNDYTIYTTVMSAANSDKSMTRIGNQS